MNSDWTGDNSFNLNTIPSWKLAVGGDCGKTNYQANLASEQDHG